MGLDWCRDVVGKGVVRLSVAGLGPFRSCIELESRFNSLGSGRQSKFPGEPFI